jgi:hypothetical protein
MKHNQLQSGGINPVFRTYVEAAAFRDDRGAWPQGFKALHVAGFTYQPWRTDGGEQAYEVVMVRDRSKKYERKNYVIISRSN